MSDVKIGFHGHNNLHLATANAVQAIKSGASFIDSTLYGLGRSAGNVPTEVMLALLNNMQIDVDIDLFNLMSAGDKYLLPLIQRIHMHDMLSVTMGASKFHSSFFPLVKKIAEKHQTDTRKLVFAVGQKCASINESEIEEIAKKIGTQNYKKIPEYDYEITSFYSPTIKQHFISNTLQSITDLIEGLINASAKGQRKIVIEIVPSKADYDMVLAEYVTSSSNMVFGRIHTSSISILDSVLEMIKDNISLLLIDICQNKNNPDFFDKILVTAKYYLKKEQILPIDSVQLSQIYMFKTLKMISYHNNLNRILFYGGGSELSLLLSMCSTEFETIYWLQPETVSKRLESLKIVTLKDLDNWRYLDFKFDIIYCASNPSNKDLKIFSRILTDSGKLIAETGSNLDLNDLNTKLLTVDFSQAYVDEAEHWFKICTKIRGNNEK